MSRTTSFDVFDTVLTRIFSHPRDLFVQVGFLLREKNRSMPEPLKFAEARWEAELRIRRKTTGNEVTLEEIYGELAPALGWDAANSLRARNLELEVEARGIRAVGAIAPDLEAARRESGKLVFLSDIYLPEPTLRGWLERVGAAKPGDLVLVSGAARANKSSGRLYEAARDATGGNFADWHHTGDHPFADVEKPRQLGITARHFEAAHLTPREKAVRGVPGEFAVPWRSLLAGAMRLARLEQNFSPGKDSVIWETGTTVAGPLFYAFVQWVLSEAARLGLRRLFFLARDGQIFWRIAKEITAAQPGAIECRYLHGSRLVFAGPNELQDPASLSELLAPTGHFHSLRQTCAHLGIELSRLDLPPAFRALDPDANLPQAVRDSLAGWLLETGQRPLLRAAFEQRTRAARAYLEAESVDPAEPIGIVDAGWRGTTQRNLELILGADGRPAPLTGFYLASSVPNPPLAGPHFGYANQFGPLPIRRDESHKVLVELFAQSDHGQVIAFAPDGARLRPVLADAGPVDLAGVRLMQGGILAFTRRMIDVASEATPPQAELARAVLATYRRFHSHPSRSEAEVFGLMPHADQLYEKRHSALCARMSLSETIGAILDPSRRPPHWWVGGQATFGNAAILRAFSWLKAARWKLAARES